MHIADGILTVEITVAADVISLGAIYLFGRKANATEVPKMGLMAAALFVVSLIHFPVAGTSIHLGLFGLAGLLLGLQSFPVIFTALLFQSLIFQHGGLLSVGLNAFNMGAGAITAVRAFSAGFIGILIPAFLMVVEFQLSGYGRGILYILYVYLIVGIFEGVFTLIIINFFRKIKSPILER